VCGVDYGSYAVHLRARPYAKRKTNLLAPTSAITAWCVEKEASVLDASPVRWQELVRVQHLTTRQYRAYSNTLGVHLTTTRNDAATVFRLHAVSHVHLLVNFII